jgi:hypothetical protein
MTIAFWLERQGREQTSLPERDRSMREIEFGLYLSDPHELNIEGRSKARDFLNHEMRKAIGPTTKFSMIDSGFRRHGALRFFRLVTAQTLAGGQSSIRIEASAHERLYPFAQSHKCTSLVLGAGL